MVNALPQSAGTAPSTVAEPGDRFQLLGSTGDGQFLLPDALVTADVPIQQIEDAAGRPVPWQQRGPFVLVPSSPAFDLDARNTLWLEYQAPGRFRLVTQKTPVEATTTEPRTEQGVPVVVEPEDERLLQGPPRRPATMPEFNLALAAGRLRTHAGFDRLICLPLVRDMELLDHQVRTAKTVLQRFHGRALLCDEVGLGKTIEAGLVFDELHVRGLVRSTLVLVPPSLIEQWQGELRRKFSLDLVSQDDPRFRQRGSAAWSEFNGVIASYHTAKREPHRSAILGRRWDLIIVDEAHHLRNRNTQLWRFASELQKQYMLLLTATPVQNNLEELFNLVTVLEPGLLRTARQFQRHFVDRRDHLTPRNVDELHRLLAEVMVRNRRSTVGLQFTRRWARTSYVSPSPAEKALYDAVAEFVRRHLAAAGSGDPRPAPGDPRPAPGDPRPAPGDPRPARGGKGKLTRMALLALQMALGSSSRAAAGTLERLAETPDLLDAERQTVAGLAEQARTLTERSKVDHLVQLLAEYADKMVVFTQFRATQEMLQERLQAAGHAVAVFHGGLTRLAKEAAIEQFRGPARVLLATEAGSEGRNLQFAHAVCNFDLPWNPMRIEQRIGRLSRIGQTKDIHVFNLVAAGTVEAVVLHLLEAKLNLFELVVGEIDMILGNLDEEREFQDLVADLWAESADLADFRARMEALGERLLAAKEAYLRQRSHDERLFGDQFSPQ